MSDTIKIQFEKTDMFGGLGEFAFDVPSLCNEQDLAHATWVERNGAVEVVDAL